MVRGICLLIALAITCGCSGDAPPRPAAPPKKEKLPPEVEFGPEEAVKHTKKAPRR